MDNVRWILVDFRKESLVDFLSTVAVKSICTSIVFIVARMRILYAIRVMENIIKEVEARWKIV